MRCKLFALLCLVLLALPMNAQTNKGDFVVKGQVLDSLSRETVPYAAINFALASAPQKSVALLACDLDGLFEVTLEKPGKYIVTLQSLGKKKTSKTFVLGKQKTLDLGKLLMRDDSEVLNEVTVTAQKKMVKVEMDKLTYSLDEDPEAQTSNTLDMLRKVPMITVDGNDEIQLQGSTNFKIYVDQVNRARYFKMLSFGGEVSYSFQPSRSMKHTVTPLHLAFNKLQNRTARFDSIARQNPMLFYSLDDQFIPSVSYTLTYDNSYRKKKSRVWWENSVTSAGNVTSLIYAAFGKRFGERDKKFLGTPFAQFLKFSSEIRHLYEFSEYHQLATRLMGGVIWAYGNKTIAPYSEQFYVGGANSIRAFTIRSIGPGRFHPAENATYSYVDETGDIKLEANVEYRFRILSNLMGGNLNGAVFLDAGNVWLMRKDEARPGAEFTLNRFFDSIALGTGVGIRYDLSFLVLRLDWGIALHVPYETVKPGYYNIPKFKDGMGIHFAIGYPF